MLGARSESSLESGQSNGLSPVPAARPLADLYYERAGDDIVLFDPALNRYHTLNPVAFEIWRSCDGARSLDRIADERSVRREAVEAAIELLGEAGLLEAPELAFDSILHRRRLIKLMAAGAVGLPVVASITSIDPASAQTTTCTGSNDCDEEECCCRFTNGERHCVVVTGPGCGPQGSGTCIQ